jgi:hypothetical protein
MRSQLFLFFAVMTLCLATDLKAGQSSRTTPEARQAILDYPLNLQRAQQLLAALPEMNKYVAALSREALAKAAARTPAEQLVAMEKEPKVAAILKQNGLTAKDYVTGVPALRMALWLAEGLPPGPTIFASPANLAFAKANLAQLRPKWEAVDGTAPPAK